MTDLTAHEARQALAEIAASEAVSQKDFDAICDDYPRLLAEWDEARALVEQMREALLAAKRAMERADEKLPENSMAGVTSSILYDAGYAIDRALAAVPDPEEPEKVVGGPGDDGDPHGEDPGIPPTREYLAVPDPEEPRDEAARQAFNDEVAQGVRRLENDRG